MRTILAVSELLIKEIFRKKDFYVALILCAVLLLYASRLEFYNVANIYKYLMEIGLTLSFTFSAILTVALAARQYPDEIQNRTCSVLMAKPLRRSQFVFGKFLGSLLAGTACFLIFYGVFVLFALSKTAALSPALLFETFYLFFLNLMVLTAMASGLSYTLTVSANVSITLIIYLLINTYGFGLKETAAGLPAVGRQITKAIYYAMPHFEFFDLRDRFIHGWDPIPLSLVFFLTIYALFYAGIFLFIGWLKFRKQPL